MSSLVLVVFSITYNVTAFICDTLVFHRKEAEAYGSEPTTEVQVWHTVPCRPTFSPEFPTVGTKFPLQ